MNEALSIPRRKPGQDDLGFERLRREAIELIQQVSGQIWTDYNLHDPGVTILEQLAYSITELAYRTKFPLADYLADADGGIDLETLGLSGPAEALPCRPTTTVDYRKLLLNAVAEADNAWLEPLLPRSQANRGLYSLSVKLCQGLSEAEQSRAIERLRETYLGARNLGEDLADIRLADNCTYELCASIEVNGDRQPADVLAEIYFNCARRIAGGAVVTGYDQVAENPPPLDELFDGPFTDHGLFLRGGLPPRRSVFSVSDLFAAINEIDGVDFIRRLYLVRGEERFYDRIGPFDAAVALDLDLPDSDPAIRVELTSKGRELPVSLEALRARYDEISFDYRRSRSTPQDLSLIFRPPRGTPRPLARYYSIQNQFPPAYGINRHGVPQSARADVKARARQLKAYLLIFEQILANFLANLEGIKTLFSPIADSAASYSTRALDPDQIGDLRAVYPADAASVCQRIMAGFDNVYRRKSRLLDYLLALYGERFSQNSLRHFNYYHPRDQLEQVIVANKVAFLAAIAELGRDRAAGLDYGRGNGDFGDSGLGRRTALLLGFAESRAHALTAAIDAQDLELVAADEYSRRAADSDGYRVLDAAEMEAAMLESLELPELAETGSATELPDLRRRIAGIGPLRDRLLSEELLHGGIFFERYRVARMSDPPGWGLLLQLDGHRFWRLETFPGKSKASAAARDLHRFLLQLNRFSEGLHVVEHILLRPKSATDTTGDEDNGAFTISVVFPAWTARCRDRQFRLLAEETLLLNTPAHVRTDSYWLEFPQMAEFEKRWARWLDLKRNPRADAEALDDSAGRLRAFLSETRAARGAGQR